jgi:Fe-S oxidoreductase
MKLYNPTKVASALMGADVLLSDRCCGEAGTMAVSRPDIATQVRFRKLEELRKGIRALTGADMAHDGNESASATTLVTERTSKASRDSASSRGPRLGPIAVKLLTSCPACQQGLSRYQPETGLQTDYIVVELANRLLGSNWQEKFVAKARAGGIEQVLL